MLGWLPVRDTPPLRIDNCDARQVYKSEDISGPKGGTYMLDIFPKSSDFCQSNKCMVGVNVQNVL